MWKGVRELSPKLAGRSRSLGHGWPWSLTLTPVFKPHPVAVVLIRAPLSPSLLSVRMPPIPPLRLRARFKSPALRTILPPSHHAPGFPVRLAGCFCAVATTLDKQTARRLQAQHERRTTRSQSLFLFFFRQHG
ncbi:hypothetical protein GQ53DRAFT_243076 [Thozetella sp. PMI_491]|nr:hypothetical protein GQ53DRAFT_243076 [Thozetella sp. PMI_491]